jgi:DNA-directed RNA polymerase subunit RPC12/RpoP
MIVSEVSLCSTCGQEFRYKDHAYKCPHLQIGKYDCHNCGKPMVEQVDPIAGAKTGHLWRCECMPSGIVISVG